MKKILLYVILVASISCKKQKPLPQVYPLKLDIVAVGNTKINMSIYDQRNNLIYNLEKGGSTGLTNELAKVKSGDVLKVNYNSTIPFNSTNNEGSATITFKWGLNFTQVISGDLGYPAGKTVSFTIPEQ